MASSDFGQNCWRPYFLSPVALAATNQELEAFAYSVSHDLRAPLRHIDGFSRILAEEFAPHLPAEGQRVIERIRAGARQAGQLVDDLLGLSRVGRTELKLEIVGLKGIVERVVKELEEEAQGREIEWRVGELPFVEGDVALIKQVFANLLSNAVKYTRPRPKAVIEVGSREQDGHTVVYVRDNGVGFSMKYADKLFGVFQRLHRRRTSREPGWAWQPCSGLCTSMAAGCGRKRNWTKARCSVLHWGADLKSRERQ